MTTGIVNIRGKEYKTVALRVGEFRDRFAIDSEWGIRTHLIQCSPDGVVVKAEIVAPNGTIVATGHAQEYWGGQINSTSAVENCETSAIGRALAAAGFGGSEFASADEVSRAIEQQGAGHTNCPAASKPRAPRKTAAAAAPAGPPIESPVWGDIASATTPGRLAEVFDKARTSARLIETPAVWEEVCSQIAGRFRAINLPDDEASKHVLQGLQQERVRLDAGEESSRNATPN